MRFDGKNIIITGGAAGIGRQTAIDAAKRGANVIIIDRNIEGLQEVVTEFSEYPIKAYQMDIGKTAETEEVLNKIIDEYKQIHVLINNAGIPSKKPIEELLEEEWDMVIDIDLKGIYNTCRIILPHMKKFHYGKIVNMASVAGKLGGGLLGTCAYAAAKSGVLGLTKCLAREGGPFGINVNAVCPGNFDTAISKEMTGDRLEKYLAGLCLRRRGKVEEVSNVMLFLASDLASYVTGECTDIDGGQVMD